LADEHELVLLDLLPDTESNIHTVDLSSDMKNWSYLFKDVDVVLHMAANSYHLAEWPDLIKPNIDAVINVYQACAEYNVARVVFASSSHVLSGYQKHDSVPLFDSETIPLPGNPYGATKLFGERQAKKFSQQYDITTVNVRIGWNPPITDLSADWVNDWLKKMWISDRDFCHLVDCCISAPLLPKWSVINGVSANSQSAWSFIEGRDLLGYHPLDNAFDTRQEETNLSKYTSLHY
jgi:nucleoside-diphosphate-sugar epimerase